jgi:signal transduction histidine kinase
MRILDNILRSGFLFEASEYTLKSRVQATNTIILLSVLGLIYGITGNIVRGVNGFVFIESLMMAGGIFMMILLRMNLKLLNKIATVLTVEYAFFYLFLIYNSNPADLKHLWIFTYPVILLVVQKREYGKYWLGLVIALLLVSPFQPYTPVQFSFYQVSYLSFVLVMVSVITFFYQKKMAEASDIILKQQKMLLDFNAKLEKEVEEKTAELRLMNDMLETKVQEKIEELIQKDKILTIQSKQAVMGEMITMIAHQWRQPLSTITLRISNLQFKRLFGNEIATHETDSLLNEISDTIIYLSNTIDDFQTYFLPKKDSQAIEVHALLQKVVNFSLPRVSDTTIQLVLQSGKTIQIQTYINELIQVVLNLMNNALDVLIEGKSENPLILLSVQEKENTIQICIKDNGSGISDENLPHIFEPYFSTKGKNGTGIGLYLSQMIIQKQFNGVIDVQTSKEGTAFIVEIPKNIV